ncbi:hypothetical protein, partial [Mycolicibacterium fortuitum]|uniref:hypothetical protein n=1 Tax=Mycolicibacterium fortuitum TaxID=1766 RepID=UPI000AEB90F1
FNPVTLASDLINDIPEGVRAGESASVWARRSASGWLRLAHWLSYPLLVLRAVARASTARRGA